VLEALTDKLRRLVGEREGKGAVALLYATAYAEDLQVCALIQRALGERGVAALLAPPTAPRASGRGLAVGKTPVRVLYRFFPTEYMEGQRNLGAIADAIEAGEVRTLSSFSQMFAQSKTAFARAFARQADLAPDDRALLEAHLPITFDLGEVSPEVLVGERRDWVLKRSLGRVGDEVFVGALFPDEVWRDLVAQLIRQRDAGEPWIAQRFVEQHPVPTPWGEQFVTLGAYVLDGRFVGYFARVTPVSHVSHGALCLPVFAELCA
jgi:hypothetical protein